MTWPARSLGGYCAFSGSIRRRSRLPARLPSHDPRDRLDALIVVSAPLSAPRTCRSRQVAVRAGAGLAARSRVPGAPHAGLVGQDDGLDPVAQLELGQEPGDVGLDGGV